MDISVIIPVLNEANGLKQCIEAIANGNYKPIEIIVADGGSTDGSASIAASCGATVIDNPACNAAAGRNVGALHAKGTILAFTDGDCIPDADWLDAINRAFEEKRPHVVAGRIVPNAPENRYEAFWNNLAWEVLMEFGTTEFRITKKDIRHSAITANCAYSKTAFGLLGGFDEWFGNNAEDVDLCWRALEAGMDILYTPDPVVFARGEIDLHGIRSKSYRNGVSSSKLQKKYGGRINYDLFIYHMLFSNLRGSSESKWPDLERNELLWHLFGKYAGAFRHRVINF